MSVYDEFGRGARERLIREFNAEHIRMNLKYSMDVERRIQTYQDACYARLDALDKIPFVWHVRIRKKNAAWLGGKTEYIVQAVNVPQIEEKYQHLGVIIGASARFSCGINCRNCRGEAVAFAKMLADQYDCEIRLMSQIKLTKPEMIMLGSRLADREAETVR